MRVRLRHRIWMSPPTKAGNVMLIAGNGDVHVVRRESGAAIQAILESSGWLSDAVQLHQTVGGQDLDGCATEIHKVSKWMLEVGVARWAR